MLEKLKELNKQKKQIDLEINEICDYSLRSVINQFNKDNKDINLLVILDSMGQLITFENKLFNGYVYENEYTIDNLNLNNLIRKGKISIEVEKHSKYKNIDIVYSNEFKSLYSDFLKIYKENKNVFNNINFDSRIPIIYKFLDNEIKKDLNNDEFLKSIIGVNFTYHFQELFRYYQRYLIDCVNTSNKYYILKEENEFEAKHVFDLSLIDKYSNINDLSFDFMKKIILESNLFDNKIKKEDIGFNFVINTNIQEKKSFNELNNFIRNELKFSPEKSLQIITTLLEINTKPSKLTNQNDKLRLMQILGGFNTFKEPNIDLYMNDQNIIENINEVYKKTFDNYLIKITKVLKFVENNFDLLKDIETLQDTLSNQKIDFNIINNKTKETYTKSYNNIIEFLDFEVYDKIEKNNDIER